MAADLFSILKAEIDTYSMVFVAVDALDEIPAGMRCQLLEYLRALSSKIHLIATSRKLLDIEDDFKNDQSLEIVAKTESMRRYVEGRISVTKILLRLLNNHEALREEVVSTVVKKADGMWVRTSPYQASL